MKKTINKNSSKIIGLIFVVVFMVSLLITNRVRAVEEWYYVVDINGQNSMTTKNSDSECLTALADSLKIPGTALVTDCTQNTNNTTGTGSGNSGAGSGNGGANTNNNTTPKTGTGDPVVNADLIKTRDGGTTSTGSLGSTSTTYTLLAPIGTQKTIETNNIGSYFNTIFQLAIGICGALAVVMLVISGIKYMGAESVFGKEDGKKGIGAAIFGLLIALGSYALLNTINPELLGTKGLNVSQVKIQVEPPIYYDNPANIPIGKPAGKCANPNTIVKITSTKTNQTFYTCSNISNSLQNMLDNAALAGVVLTGGGFRTYKEQQALREQNSCKETSIPPTSCKPVQVAIPGTSNHESGSAFDFRCNGREMVTTDICYTWLSKSQNPQILISGYTLLGEPWHWSTTGN